jgi:hypothetical protein
MQFASYRGQNIEEPCRAMPADLKIKGKYNSSQGFAEVFSSRGIGNIPNKKDRA